MPTPKAGKPKIALLEAFGAEVRQRRQALGYSQEAFGDHCGIDRSYMGGIERGEHNLALINVFRIIESLDVKPSEFFAGLDTLTTAGRRRR